jgi:putative nucleotidyltransferase with HDIG domain
VSTLAHLSGRFVRALWPGPPRADDVAWVERVLTPNGFALFRRQPNHDQRHAIGVARDVEARLADTEYADDPRWLSAALLHDIGKLASGLGVYGRVVATVSGAVAGRDHAGAWSASSGFTRRVGLYLRHAELGADRLRLAGEPEEAALWAASHHDPSTWGDLGIPAPVVEALDAADND